VSDARVDLIIAVHTPTRPVGRAVASVLDGNAANVRLTVACHNTDPDGILAVIDDRHRGSVTVLEHIDEHRSASGPFNAGMRAARGEFVSIMGSDDTLRPGAVDSWLAHADANGAETVMTRLALGHPDAVVPTPPVRPFTRGLADPIADRLSYRSAPLGLVSVAAKERLGAELVEGAVVGGDVPYVTRLWFETTVAVDRTGPAYVIGEDARDRVTYEPRPIAVELAFVRHLLAADWFAAYPTNARGAVVTKLTRIHLFGAVHNRTDPTWWTDQERIDLAHVARLLLDAAPGFERALSLADRHLLDAIRSRRAMAADMIAAAEARRRHGRPDTLLTRNLGGLLATEGPLRMMAASLLARR
jgi:hypothetical protein